MDIPLIKTKRLYLTLPEPHRASDVADYFVRNRGHLHTTMPTRPPAYFTVPYWADRLSEHLHDYREDRSACLVVFDRRTDAVVGTCFFTQILRGPYQGCFLGYSMDGQREGQGLMTEAVRAALRWAFEALDLHKINAGHLPDNHGSAKVLAKLGFERIGVAPKELILHGQWRDHVLTRLLNPAWQGRFE